MLGTGSLALFFSLQLVTTCYHYFDLKNQAKAHISQWETVEIKERFVLKANYTFSAKEKTWQASSILNSPYYLNEPAALTALKIKAKENWVVWYSPKNPSRSSLEKQFPLGLAIKTSICFGVLIYFLYLYKKLIRL